MSSNKSPFMQGSAEREYIKRCRPLIDHLIPYHKDSVQEGFEYFFTQMDKPVAMNRAGFFRRMQQSGLGKVQMAQMLIRTFRKMRKGINGCFKDLEPYLDEIEQNGLLSQDVNITRLVSTYPNEDLWKELQTYAKDKWNIIKIGFTELPTQLIFKGKMVLFRHALVFMEEMKKDKIDQAPDLEAGFEVMRVYASLGIAVNDIARWLRSKGIRCQSNHPLGGLVCTPPLAGKAGMGWQGMNGCLITPEFGSRQRLAPIFIEGKVFEYTDNTQHQWIEEYCASCGLCQQKCPTQAIQEQKSISIANVPGIGAMRTCIDRDKCFPYFQKTLGCSVCVKVCPFSKGSEKYSKLKKSIEN
ncbi:MAG: 4Fe-4S binding protein [Promethearchaeota archaeon]